MFAPMFVIARSTLACAPSPIATTQMTAPTPMMMPNIVSAVRMTFWRSAFSANRGIINRFIASPCHLTRLRRLNIDLGALADFVRAAPDDRVSVLQRTEHFDQVPDARAATHIHPLRHTIVDADHERALRRGDDAGWRHEERGLRPPDWPLHFGIHARAEPQVRVLDVQFRCHASCLLIQ